jgi:ABC-2 type transport system permease protein
MALGLRWAGTGVFLATEVRVQLHEWLAILTGSTVQAVLVIFVAVLAPPLLAFALVGALVHSFFLIGQRVLNEAAYVRIDHRLNELYHASPLSPEAYFLGMAGGVMVAYLPPVVLFLGLLEVVHPLSPVAAATLAAALLAVWLFSSSLGYFISTLFKDMKTIWPYSSLLTNLFGVVPPVFYPLALVPPDLRWPFLLVPTSAAAALVNTAAGLEASPDLALAAGSLAVASSALLVFGSFWARRASREA